MQGLRIPNSISRPKPWEQSDNVRRSNLDTTRQRRNNDSIEDEVIQMIHEDADHNDDNHSKSSDSLTSVITFESISSANVSDVDDDGSIIAARITNQLAYINSPIICDDYPNDNNSYHTVDTRTPQQYDINENQKLDSSNWVHLIPPDKARSKNEISTICIPHSVDASEYFPDNIPSSIGDHIKTIEVSLVSGIKHAHTIHQESRKQQNLFPDAMVVSHILKSEQEYRRDLFKEPAGISSDTKLVTSCDNVELACGMPITIIGGKYSGKCGTFIKQTAKRTQVIVEGMETAVNIMPNYVKAIPLSLSSNDDPRNYALDVKYLQRKSYSSLVDPDFTTISDLVQEVNWAKSSQFSSSPISKSQEQLIQSLHCNSVTSQDRCDQSEGKVTSYKAGMLVDITGGKYIGKTGTFVKQTPKRIQVIVNGMHTAVSLLPDNIKPQKPILECHPLLHNRSEIETQRMTTTQKIPNIISTEFLDSKKGYHVSVDKKALSACFAYTVITACMFGDIIRGL
jgi:ribosomal protein L24